MIKQQENVQSLNTNFKFKITYTKLPQKSKGLYEQMINKDNYKVVYNKSAFNLQMIEESLNNFKGNK